MEEEKKHIDELIATYLTEGLDKNALAELKAWIAASPENEDYFIQQREVWFSAVSREAASKYNKDKAFDTFKNRIGNRKQVEKAPRREFRLSTLWRYAAIIAVILAVGCFSYWQGGVNVKDTFADISVEAPLGSKTKLYLPDGTLVWLNAGSRIIYSQGFGVDNRKVELEGEGYFEVRRNEKLPFSVKTRDLQLQVLGTKFNFRNYPEDHEVVVSLLEGSSIRLLDTRKTTPNMRIFEKYAVRVGGGYNHRYNLSDGVLLKDNHINAAGGVAEAVKAAQEYAPFVRKIEVETETLEMVREAVEAGADIIMLDNMTPEDMKKAVEITAGKAKTECSGNVTRENIENLKKIGVDYISCGALTHSAPILDVSLKNFFPYPL